MIYSIYTHRFLLKLVKLFSEDQEVIFSVFCCLSNIDDKRQQVYLIMLSR